MDVVMKINFMIFINAVIETAVQCYIVSIVLVLLLVNIMTTLGEQQETCYADVKNPYIYFDAKTSYEFVHGNQISPVECE